MKLEPFEAENISDAKRLVRADLYMMASQEVRAKCPTILMLPGNSPESEVNTIKTAFPVAKVTAFDARSLAVSRAKAAGIQEVIKGDLAMVNDKNQSEYLGDRTFDFANIDLCSHLSMKTIKTLEGIMPHCNTASVFLSYSRDAAFDPVKVWGDRWKSKYRNFTERYKDINGLDEHILERVYCLWRIVTGISMKFELKRVYLYRGHVIPMMGMVFSQVNAKAWDPFMIRVSNEDLGFHVLEMLNYAPENAVCDLYDVNKLRIAAWKAARTKGQGVWSK